jgi:hypothetical protein
MRTTKSIKYLILLLLFASYAFSQSLNISIRTNIDSCLVFIDSQYIGKTPISSFSIQPGTYKLKAVTGDLEVWHKQMIEKTIVVDSASKNLFLLEFKNKMRIETEPDNAEVFINNQKTGNTPCEILYNRGDTLSIMKEDYEEKTLIIDKINNKPEIFKLVPKKNLEITFTQPEIGHNKGTYYALIGGGLAFGIMSVLTKHKADNLETEYRIGPTNELKTSIRKYDLLSGISLGIFEACFLTLSYLLLSD